MRGETSRTSRSNNLTDERTETKIDLTDKLELLTAANQLVYTGCGACSTETQPDPSGKNETLLKTEFRCHRCDKGSMQMFSHTG